MIINSINKFIQQSFLTTPLKNISSKSWAALAILAFSSFVIVKYSCFFARKIVALWNKNESSTTSKVDQVAASINLDQSELATDVGDENTCNTENETVPVLTHADDDLGARIPFLLPSVDQCTNMGQDRAQASANRSAAMEENLRKRAYTIYVASRRRASISRDIHQARRYFMGACIGLATVPLTASITYIYDSSCNHNYESLLCRSPIKNMVVGALVTGFVAINCILLRQSPEIQ